MRCHWLAFAAISACSTAALAQSFEAAVEGGQSRFPDKNADLGTATSDLNSGHYTMKNGFRISARMAINSWRFRLDVRQYNMGKPFKLPNAGGRLLMWEFSGGLSFLL